MDVRRIGVEEELLLVDPATGRLTAVAAQAVRRHGASADEVVVEEELFLQQIETQTPPCADLDELDAEVRRSRQSVCEAAERAGARAVAIAAPVLSGDDAVDITPRPRYLHIREQYGETARTALASAMHVHVDVSDLHDPDDPDRRVAILDDIAPWLPVLLALSANSPYHLGNDTGYASWRSELWSRWPSSGTGEAFGSAAAYDEITDLLVDWGAALDRAMAYFPARLSQDHPTVEIRVADVCTDPEDAVLVAALARALVMTAVDTTGADRRARDPWRSELLRAATWRAARFGLSGRLVHPGTRRLAPVREVLDALRAHVAPALEAAGDSAYVERGLERLLGTGNGATRQHRVFEETGRLEAVVHDAAERTRAAWSSPA